MRWIRSEFTDLHQPIWTTTYQTARCLHRSCPTWETQHLWPSIHRIADDKAPSGPWRSKTKKSLDFAEISFANLTWLGNPTENGSFNGHIMGNDGKMMGKSLFCFNDGFIAGNLSHCHVFLWHTHVIGKISHQLGNVGPSGNISRF